MMDSSYTIYDNVSNAILGAFVEQNIIARNRFLGHVASFDPNNYRHLGINVYVQGTAIYYECLIFPEQDGIACGFAGAKNLQDWFKEEWVKEVPINPRHHQSDQFKVQPSPRVVNLLSPPTLDILRRIYKSV